MLLVFVFQSLWNLTIVGGVIKHYSYSQVPFIVAENPDINPLQAITLSRRMMNGHKAERFVLDLSFIPWDLLNAVTFGLLGVFFLNAYKIAVLSEYYTALRSEYKDSGSEDAGLLNDRYLFETAETGIIDEAYADLIELSETPDEQPYLSNSKIKVFFAKWFGVVLSYNNDEDRAYRAHQIRMHKLERLEKIRALELYPGRLFPIPESERTENAEDLGPARCYSISSLILIFFSLCLVGWIWEVMLHLVNDGVFVNRGTLHGPWLPIYGAGSVLIIVCAVLITAFTADLIYSHFVPNMGKGITDYGDHDVL